MFLKIDDKKDKEKNYRYYKLCESYRIGNKTRHRTILNLGKIDDVETPEDRKLLADRIEQLINGEYSLFTGEIPAHIEKHAQHFYEKIKNAKVNQHTITKIEQQKQEIPQNDYQEVDLSTITMEDVREVGCEWLCKQVIEELGLVSFLEEMGLNQKQITTAIIQIISKAVFPASEHKTAQWLNENTALNELFALQPDSINRFHLYKSSKLLYYAKDEIENFLSVKTNELFDLDDKIILYDLTNTYFEGRKDTSKLAQFAKSKEKRNDAKLVALALVVNNEGFVKYSNIYQGNIADCKTLENLIAHLSKQTSFTCRKPIIVIDAGIATEENINMMKLKNHEFVCVTRSKLKDYQTTDSDVVHLQDRNGKAIDVRWVKKNKKTPNDNDKYLYIHSQMKAVKETSMSAHFNKRYEEELNNLIQSIHKKGGTKKYEKVIERIGRIKERYSSANKHYKINVEAKDGIAVKITWEPIKPKPPAQEGVYFIRTNIKQTNETKIWNIYNTIREIEATFRILKSDLHLRPIYHIKDEFTKPHLYLGILAYTIVNTIRYRLKQQGIKHDWQNIVRIMNTQKVATVFMKGRNNKQIMYRVCSKPTIGALEIYNAMGFEPMPFYRKKICVTENQNSIDPIC